MDRIDARSSVGAGAPALSSDVELVESAAVAIARPKVAPADSFILHAPLELLARCALLSYCRPGDREPARARIDSLRRAYAAAGEELDEPGGRDFPAPAAALGALASAIERGELDDADATADWLARRLTAPELARGLARVVIPSLAAAAHGGIFLYQLPRIAPRSVAAARMLRGLVRELALEREWALRWQRSRPPGVVPSGDLLERLRRPPSPGDPGSPFIYPTMALVERSGLAAELLDAPTRALAPPAASRLLGRVAAWSMLQDDPAHAPYGWSHCLTMPQAVLAIAGGMPDASEPVAVAATYVLGFRATLGRVELDPGWEPTAPRRPDRCAVLDGSPADAAAAVWHASDEAVPDVVARLAARAAAHADAHLAKYTIACFDAAAADPEEARLYLAAAAFLSAWWAERGEV